MSDRNPMLDAFLTERVRGEGPPDLSARILAAAAARRAAREQASVPSVNGSPVLAPLSLTPPTVAGEGSSKSHPVAPLVAAPVAQAAPASLPRRQGVPTSWILATAAAAVLTAVGAYWLAKPPVDRLAERPARSMRTAPASTASAIAVQTGDGPRPETPTPTDTAIKTPATPGTPTRVPGHTEPRPAPTHSTTDDSPAAPAMTPPNDFAAHTPSATPANNPNNTPSKNAGSSPFASPKQPAVAPIAATAGRGKSWNDDEVVALIDGEIERRWIESGVSPSPRATDAEWCRRVFLDLLGRIPTVDEVRAFTGDPRSDKRARLVDELLFSERYLEPFVDHWTTIYANLLIGRSGGMAEGAEVNRPGLQKWLRDSFGRSVSYDKVVAALIAGDGVNAPSDEGFAGEVNFLLDNAGDSHISATNKIAQVFLGVRLGCAQCHNHPFNDWKQEHFWGLNAFFKQMRVERLREGDGEAIVRLTDGDFTSELGDSHEAEIYYETRNGLLQVAYPTFLDGRKINPSGDMAVVNRRDELAKLIVESSYAKTAVVNRLWGHFLGFGLVHPVDDFGPHNPPSHPAVLNTLSEAFAGSGWDLRRAMKWIVLSKPYQLSSRIDPRNRVDVPEAGETPLFTRFYLRQMRAEALFESLVVATKMDRDLPADFFARQGRQQAWMQQFVIDFDTDENDETVTFDGSITQSLMMMNGDLMAQATSIEPGSFLNTVAAAPTGEREKISELYLAALGRQPTSHETQLAQQLWTARRGDAPGTLQDVWWALLNSNEFIMNH